ncbi:hypothetical protein [Paenibacillus sp. FSL K6-1318]|uniref:hypothetical protein n=1 Tax=Paenibacillus sp. FSL K6-1318 TaxID=2975291 RepID=UPI0030EEE752
MSLINRRDKNGRRVSALAVSTGLPLSAEEGVNGEDVATFGPSTTHGYDAEKGAVRMMKFAQRTSELKLLNSLAVPAGGTVNSSENWAIEDFSKMRLFALTLGQGVGNIDVVLRLSVNGGYNFSDAHTFSMGAEGKSVMSPIVELGATHFKLALVNKSSSAQNIDVWGLVFA